MVSGVGLYGTGEYYRTDVLLGLPDPFHLREVRYGYTLS